jgi:hypothetical protein
MKNILAVLSIVAFAAPAVAGNLVPVEIEPAPIVVENKPASSVSPLLILGLIILIGIAVSQNDDDQPTP